MVSAYVLCFGVTALLIYPVQFSLLGDISVYASLVFLPHGVRVLATWILGWKAVPPLFVAGIIADYLFSTTSRQVFLESGLLQSYSVGAMSALLAFESFRLFRKNSYAGGVQVLDWKRLLMVGALASVFNSIGQSVVYSGLILPQRSVAVFSVYAIGDLVGLFVSMLALMLIFRAIRLSGASDPD